ncbi:hypothetical protein P152DRAFT_289178 [Eremomyces bilateralis CBS 781.70]|uniref:Uncharacterized protein n=1 Tax=Eremomyces bilateralis CBS 781.70 TaxID=1392243 RepID=A0A6G1G790_9PEZI|nr:uncharacterized protein P152DRAFT_289178 [Eremomyces bilateralis CBS 781.70]KAF1813699.1 hypothetical protein P152DRAFT_289178 [Eremomyces bilateralis CBS 781.70]
MLSKTHEDESVIKTVTLARGTFSGQSPPGIGPSSAARSTTDRSSFGSISKSSSSPETGDGARTLTQIGILELMEQDTRPTFVVDLAEARNYNSGPLHVIWANSALSRGCPGLLEAVSGELRESSNGSDLPHPKDFGQFKSWTLSAVMIGDGLDPLQPTIYFKDMTWSCSTIRKRLRVVSALKVLPRIQSRAASARVSPAIGHHSRPFMEPLRSISSATNLTTVLQSAEEPQDYFGGAGSLAATVCLSPPPSEPKTSSPHEIPSSIIASEPTSQPHSTATEISKSPRSPRTPGSDNIHPIRTLKNQISSIFETHPSLTNECVLSAAASADIDSFTSPSYGTFGANLPSGNRDDTSALQDEDNIGDIGFFDWTRLSPTVSLPTHIQFARDRDWASTSLGPMDFWPPDLRQMCNLIMASPHPAAMYWGEDLVAIYNEAYVLLAGQKHPELMGQSYKAAWVEIWDEVKDVFHSARDTGQATMKDDDCLFIMRNSFLEETYFSWSIIPMVGSDGTVTGLYNPAFEKTRRKIAERRMFTLREVGERTATARDVKSFWGLVTEALATNERDTPFALLYSVSDESDRESSSIHSNSAMEDKHCFLEGALGVPDGHPCAPKQIELKSGMEGFGPFFRECMNTDKPALLHIAWDTSVKNGDGAEIGEERFGEIPAATMEGIQWRGFGDPCRSVVVCPVHPTTGELILGYLVLGVNPRRPFDDDYSLFLQLLSRQLATSLASVVLFEEEIRRGKKAAKIAALDHIELSQQLAARTQEARDIETRFTRMAEFSPVGLFIANSNGNVVYCNDAWFEITKVPKEEDCFDKWMDSVKEEDQERIRGLWKQLVENKTAVTAEFRFKAPWQDQKGNTTDGTWVLFSAYPERYAADCVGYPAGSLKSIFGVITNISQQKWAEDFQKRKMEEAVELKRQQENFIDVTSHEMRNPLSAILQCADEIQSTLHGFIEQEDRVMDKHVVQDNIDAAETIALCAMHQKRIVDDILTFSRLDSGLLIVTPIDVQPLTIAQKAVKMFEGQLQNADIHMNFIIDPSYHKLGIDWVKMDPSRVLQIFINLITNAIKFTSEGPQRTITLTIAATTEPTRDRGREVPSKSSPDLPTWVDYFPTRSQRPDITDSSPDWGTGAPVYIHFAVQDTGKGLTENEKKMLFLRFSQASPRTHVQYGGSGLGLFISRELTELQGGEIGVASEAGKGSTFAFYIKARRCENAVEEMVVPVPLAVDREGSQSRAGSRGPDSGSTSRVRLDGLSPAREPASRKSWHVLIVEDNLVNQRVLVKQLRNKGLAISTANHGGEGLEVLKKSKLWHRNRTKSEREAPHIDVVLMDQEMPVMDGLEATKAIRELERKGELLGHVPIIAVTANARSEQVKALLDAGSDDVVSKPFRIPELIPKIEELADKFTRGV